MYPCTTSVFCSRLRFFAMCMLLMIGAVQKGYGQDKIRRYANVQQSYLQGGTIANGSRAVDGDPKNYSTLSVPLGLLNLLHSTQYLDFGKTFQAGTPVTIKLTPPGSVLGLVDNVNIQPYTNLRFNGGLGARWEATSAGSSFAGGTLVNLLAGKGSVEWTI